MGAAVDISNDHAPKRCAPAARLRVLLVTEAAAKGTGRHVLDLAEGLIARGCDVHLLYSPFRLDDSFRTRMWSMPGLRHVALPMRRSVHPSDIRAAWSAREYLHQFGPFDIVHGHSSKGGAVARLAAMGSGAATFYTPHALVTMSAELPGWKRRFFALAELVLSKLTTRIIAVGAEEARFALAAGLGESRVVMVPNGVGALQLPPRHEARRACGVGDDEIVVGWVGRLVADKAPEVLINAMATALNKAPRMRAVLVGDGPMRVALAELAARLGLARKVSLLGELDARQILPAFDIFASSSRMEAMPYAILEAMAAGLPIVAMRTSGAELLVEPGVNGTIVPTDDCEGLAAALVSLTADPGLAERMGAASRQRVAQFTIDKMVERTLALYESCVSSVATDDEPQLAADVE